MRTFKNVKEKKSYSLFNLPFVRFDFELQLVHQVLQSGHCLFVFLVLVAQLLGSPLVFTHPLHRIGSSFLLTLHLALQLTDLKTSGAEVKPAILSPVFICSFAKTAE